jgi:predicted PurR-regulated permease PerM
LEGRSNASKTALIVLALLATMAALQMMKVVLVPVAFALILACILYPFTSLLRRILPLNATGAAVLLFLLLTMVGLYAASLTAESLIKARSTLPADTERLAGNMSRRVSELIQRQPYLRGVLPAPGTIDSLGDRNRLLLMTGLRDRLADLSGWVMQGFVVLVLVLFLLAESEMLFPKVVRFFTTEKGDARASERTLRKLVRQIRAYLVARTLINLALGVVVALALSLLGVRFPVALGAFAALTNFVPYVGQVVGGALPVLVTLSQSESIGDALIVAAVYLAVVTIEGYVITPYVLGRSLDLNGTTVLLACLFWGFLWGLVGLILAIPITVSVKLIFQHVPELNRWAELMSRDWQTPVIAGVPPVIAKPVEPAVIARVEPPREERVKDAPAAT